MNRNRHCTRHEGSGAHRCGTGHGKRFPSHCPYLSTRQLSSVPAQGTRERTKPPSSKGGISPFSPFSLRRHLVDSFPPPPRGALGAESGGMHGGIPWMISPLPSIASFDSSPVVAVVRGPRCCHRTVAREHRAALRNSGTLPRDYRTVVRNLRAVVRSLGRLFGSSRHLFRGIERLFGTTHRLSGIGGGSFGGAGRLPGNIERSFESPGRLRGDAAGSSEDTGRPSRKPRQLR